MKIKINLHCLAGITQKRAVKALFSLWSLRKTKSGYTEKVKEKDFKVKKAELTQSDCLITGFFVILSYFQKKITKSDKKSHKKLNRVTAPRIMH